MPLTERRLIIHQRRVFAFFPSGKTTVDTLAQNSQFENDTESKTLAETRILF